MSNGDNTNPEKEYKNMEKYVLIMLILNRFPSQHAMAVSNKINKADLVKDMSHTCVENLNTNIYLPFGMGVADASIVLLSDNDLYPDCKMTYYSSENEEGRIYMIIVIEFLDYTEGPYNACQEGNSMLRIQIPGTRSIDVCQQVNKLKLKGKLPIIYRMSTNAPSVSITIKSKTMFESIKITVTSAWRLRQYEMCDSISETTCLISNISVCVSKELECDTNINCGSPSLNDEDERICDKTKYNRLWVVVLSGALMIMVIILFLIHLLRSCVPSVPDNFFIFNEDEDNKLILSTQFSAAPENLRPGGIKPLPTAQSSSFRFRNKPISRTPSLTSIAEENAKRKKESGDSDNAEEELIASHIFKEPQSKELGVVAESEEAGPSARKPTFPETQDPDFIRIMDRIEPAKPKRTSKTKELKFTRSRERTSRSESFERERRTSGSKGKIQKRRSSTTFTGKSPRRKTKF